MSTWSSSCWSEQGAGPPVGSTGGPLLLAPWHDHSPALEQDAAGHPAGILLPCGGSGIIVAPSITNRCACRGVERWGTGLQPFGVGERPRRPGRLHPRLGRDQPLDHILRGPGGETSVEPLVMQVLLVLCDARVAWSAAKRCSADAGAMSSSARTASTASSPKRGASRARSLPAALRSRPSRAPAIAWCRIRPRRPTRAGPTGAGPTGAGRLVAAGAARHSRRESCWVPARSPRCRRGAWWIGRPDPLDARVAALIGQSEQAHPHQPARSRRPRRRLPRRGRGAATGQCAGVGAAGLRAVDRRRACAPKRAATAVAGVQDAARRALALDRATPTPARRWRSCRLITATGGPPSSA